MNKTHYMSYSMVVPEFARDFDDGVKLVLVEAYFLIDWCLVASYPNSEILRKHR